MSVLHWILDGEFLLEITGLLYLQSVFSLLRPIQTLLFGHIETMTVKYKRNKTLMLCTLTAQIDMVIKSNYYTIRFIDHKTVSKCVPPQNHFHVTFFNSLIASVHWRHIHNEHLG